MDYTLNVRAFLDIKRKDKAIAHAERLFPNLQVHIIGRYYKDDSLWECIAKKEYDYADDKTEFWKLCHTFPQYSRIGCC